MDKKPVVDQLSMMGIVLLVTMILVCIVEGGIVLYAYLTADKVECNFIFCTFTTERTSVNTTTSITSSITSRCYTNGIEVEYDNETINDIKNMAQKYD